MKKFTLALLGLLLMGIGFLRLVKPSVVVLHPIQQKAEHLIMFLDENGKPESMCTGTAIGPAAFMTAEHCNNSPNPSDLIKIDLSTHRYHLLGGIGDGRDHVIYFLSEAPFKSIIDVAANIKSAANGERVYVFGCGGGECPCVRKVGFQVNRDTISDVDEAQGFVNYSIPIIAGDSGSAIFGSDGRIIALISYRHENDDGSVGSGAFDINFSEDQISIAKMFDPTKLPM